MSKLIVSPPKGAEMENTMENTNKMVQVFSSSEFGQVRTVQIDGEPWLVGKDVAEILGYSDTNKAVAMHVDDEDKKLNDKTSSSFGQRGATLINESGMYALVLSSKLPAAKKFKRWITSKLDHKPNVRQSRPKWIALSGYPRPAPTLSRYLIFFDIFFTFALKADITR